MNSSDVKVLVLSGDGINCENETANAFQYAGAKTTIMHVNELIRKPSALSNFDVMAIPGGFSFGDELGSGKLLALKLKMGLANELDQFIFNKKPIIGICNGFQVLVKMGLLPFKNKPRKITLTHNDSGEFINKWVELLVPKNSKCKWLNGLNGKKINLPIRHGEGKVVLKDSDQTLTELEARGLISLKYTSDVNGSDGHIAGLCDEEGLIFGLMPHPEANVFNLTNPFNKTKDVETFDIGHTIFKNMVEKIEDQKRYNEGII